MGEFRLNINRRNRRHETLPPVIGLSTQVVYVGESGCGGATLKIKMTRWKYDFIDDFIHFVYSK